MNATRNLYIKESLSRVATTTQIQKIFSANKEEFASSKRLQLSILDGTAENHSNSSVCSTPAGRRRSQAKGNLAELVKQKRLSIASGAAYEKQLSLREQIDEESLPGVVIDRADKRAESESAKGNEPIGSVVTVNPPSDSQHVKPASDVAQEGCILASGGDLEGFKPAPGNLYDDTSEPITPPIAQAHPVTMGRFNQCAQNSHAETNSSSVNEDSSTESEFKPANTTQSEAQSNKAHSGKNTATDASGPGIPEDASGKTTLEVEETKSSQMAPEKPPSTRPKSGASGTPKSLRKMHQNGQSTSRINIAAQSSPTKSENKKPHAAKRPPTRSSTAKRRISSSNRNAVGAYGEQQSAAKGKRR